MLGSLQSGYSHGEGRDVTLETGLLAGQADGAVVVSSGDTQVLVTVVASSEVRTGIDFLPLTVDVEERMYAVGKIPGSFFRREGRPTEKAILSARLIDRPLRPSFDDGFRNEVQVIATILSADQENQPDVMAINGASAALIVSGIPFLGPIGAVRLARIDDRWVPNPTFQELERATFDLLVAGRRREGEGAVDILMVEAGATDDALDLIAGGAPDVTEEVVASGLHESTGYIAASCDAQLALRDLVDPPPREFPVFADYLPETYDRVDQAAAAHLHEVISIADKGERVAREEGLREAVIAAVCGPEPSDEEVRQVKVAFRSVMKKAIRRRVIEEGLRIDGRQPGEIRPLSARVGLVKRAHGSGLFQRGETQVLTITTLGMLRMAQMLDTIGVEETKRYMHNYNFPPFSTGETGRVGAPRRREIGHGALAEKALIPVVPKEEDLPYALRVVSEVLSSNGSTSMASVCASTLSLMDAGVRIKAPVGGIAMGLIADGGSYVTLTDILGAEDAFGDMDFKVAGTRTTVTALQLDTKVIGLPAEVLAEALGGAHDARMRVLDAIEEAIPAPREEMSAFAPRIISVQIPVDKIGEIIGPKGKVINEIQAETGASIDVQDDGTIHIGGTEAGGVERARGWIEQIVNPPRAEIGARYRGKVVNITKFGAFINILPGRDGLVHISKLGGGRRLDRVEDVLSMGEEIEVIVEDIDRNDRVSLRPVSETALEDDEVFEEDEWEDMGDEIVDEELDDLEAPDERARVPAGVTVPNADGSSRRRRRRRRGAGEEASPRVPNERPRDEAWGEPPARSQVSRRDVGSEPGRHEPSRRRETRTSPRPRRERVSFEDEFERQSRSGSRRRGR
jgi:polyribonucleotide nucleotidyltransferase